MSNSLNRHDSVFLSYYTEEEDETPPLPAPAQAYKQTKNIQQPMPQRAQQSGAVPLSSRPPQAYSNAEPRTRDIPTQTAQLRQQRSNDRTQPLISHQNQPVRPNNRQDSRPTQPPLRPLQLTLHGIPTDPPYQEARHTQAPVQQVRPAYIPEQRPKEYRPTNRPTYPTSAGPHPNSREEYRPQNGLQQARYQSPARQQQSNNLSSSAPSKQAQISITKPFQPSVPAPRAAFIAAPSPTMSSTEGGFAPSPDHGLPPHTSPIRRTLGTYDPSNPSLARNAASTVSKTDPDNDRLAPALPGQADFWRRFSMVAKEAEWEKLHSPEEKRKDPWLSREFRSTWKFKLIIWIIAILVFGGAAGALAWHFTHNSSTVSTLPTQHNFGLGSSTTSSSTAAATVGGALGRRHSGREETRFRHQRKQPSRVGSA